MTSIKASVIAFPQNNKPPVEELVSDLRDGEVLLSLLEILTAQQYVRLLFNLFSCVTLLICLNSIDIFT